MKPLHSPTQHSQYVNLLLFPVYGEASCPIFTIYFLTLPASPPLCIPLFVPAVLIDCLFISGPAAASAPVDEIVMVSVIFCGVDKEGESHREEIGFGIYGG